MPERVKKGLPPGGRPTLGEEARTLARARIIGGALAALATHGLEATVDNVAESAGVSRRTVFRHFATHGELLAAAIDEGRQLFEDRMPGPPSPGTDVEIWLIETAVAMHELYRQIVGRAFWDIHIDRPGMSSEVIAALAGVAAQRHRFNSELANTAWRALGGKRSPPEWVIAAFDLQLSAFATNAMAAYDAQQAGHVSGRILWAVLSTALAEQREVARR